MPTKDGIDSFCRIAIVVLLSLITYRINDIDNRMGGTPAPIVKPDPDGNPKPPGPPSSPLAAAGKAYHLGSAKEFADLRDKIKNGTIATAQGVADYMAGVAKPFGDAIKGVVAASCDSKGNITNPSGLANEFDILSKNLEK